MANEKLIYASAARRAVLKADPSLAYVIDEVKAVDAVEVVHGRWIPRMYDNSYILYHCSECGSPNARERNYCPECGAKMNRQ